tara:strand:- start:1538 stop:3790 length:2253 start_codon:yes stop_codon:yes gene_type:complete
MASSRYAFDPANPGKSYGQILAGGGSANATRNYDTESGVNDQYYNGDVPTMALSPNINEFIPVATTTSPNLFDDSNWMSDNMDLTYDIPADDMQANYEYEAYGGSRGPDWSFNPIPPNTTPSEPNRTPSPVNTTGGSRAPSGPAPIPQVLISQDLTRRPQTGNIYSPDLSAYNDSSLFNYTGPGGVDEYTYGQGLRTGGADYSIFGSPADIANPYYEGQFTPMAQPVTPEPVGPADGAINMNPVQLPSDLPQIEVSADVSMPGFVGGSLPTDLTYQQTIDEMGIFGPNNPPPSTTFPSPGDNTGLTQNMTSSDKEYQDMLNQSLMMDNQLMNQLDSSDPRGGEKELNKNVGKLPSMAMDDTADIERGMITSQRGTTMDDTAAIEQGMRESQRGTTMDDTTDIQMGMMQGTPNPQLGLPVPEFNDLPEQGLTPLQQAARDASSNIDTRDFRFNPTGEQDKSLLQKWVESGPAYQPTSDSTIAEMEAMGNQVKSFADKTAQVRNLFDETVINTVGSPNQFEIQRAEADANQAALDKQRYNTQINNPTADFSGYMKNYGSGFKEPVEVSADVSMPGFSNVNFDSSLDPSNQASNYPATIFTGSPSAGIDANTAQEIAARTEAMNAPDGNELMLEAIGLGSNLFNEVPKAEREQAQKEMVNIFANAYNKTQDQPKPAVIKTTSKKPEPERVTVKYNQNKPVKVAKTKPTGRGPQPVKVTRTTGSRGTGGYSRPASSSPSPSPSYSNYSRLVGGR